MTINQIKKLFESIAGAHYFIKHFEYGYTPSKADAELDETKYPALYVVHDDSTQLTNTIQRTYTLIVCDLVDTGMSNNDEVESDTEQTLSDIIKILRQESDYYDVIGDPKITPFKDGYGDAVTGNEATVVIETLYNTGFCDVPSDIFGYPGTTGSNGLPVNPGIDCDDLNDCSIIQNITNEISNINNAGYITLIDISATGPLSYNNNTGVFSITQASLTQDGYLTIADYTNFYNGYNSISGLVPYTGANQNVNLGNYSLTTNDIIVGSAADTIGSTVGSAISLNGNVLLKPVGGGYTKFYDLGTGFNATLDLVLLTADRSIALPDASGKIAR